jgi:hypothetical protein
VLILSVSGKVSSDVKNHHERCHSTFKGVLDFFLFILNLRVRTYYTIMLLHNVLKKLKMILYHSILGVSLIISRHSSVQTKIDMTLMNKIKYCSIVVVDCSNFYCI